MSKKLLFIFFIYSLQANNAFGEEKISGLLSEVDRVLAASEEYMQQKEQRIDRLKSQLSMENLPEKQFELTYAIIEEYKSYQSDSAFTYVEKNRVLAREHQNSTWQIRTKLQYSFILSSSGLFEESIRNMNSISLNQLTEETRVDYYKRTEQLYVNFCVYQQYSCFTDKYIGLIHNARDSILNLLPENSPEQLSYIGQKAQSNKDYDLAAQSIKASLALLPPTTHEYAKKSYHYYMIKEQQGQRDENIEYLIRAVIADAQDAVKENKALSDLAVWLYEKGDIDRAYHYIKHSLNDANFYNARFRYFNISQVLPIITEAYEIRSSEQSKGLIALLIAISFLLFALLAVCILLYKQAATLRQTRKGLKGSNEELEGVNKALNALNHDLLEANRVKEEYISYFLDLCSEYIGKLEDYRKLIYNRLAAKRYDELLKITTSTRHSGVSETKELYTNFDKAFLSIYSGFVAAFNELLKEEERFSLPKEDVLNTELRVFALIRMGITDSTRIATFLRCSVQTVYNYRSKIKRKCLNENEDFESTIKRIGKIS